MKYIKNTDHSYIPASHENPNDPGVWKKVLLGKDDLVKGRIMMVNWAKIPAGKSFEPHYHEDMQEIFILLDGMVTMNVNDTTIKMNRGDVVVVDGKEVHEMTNNTDHDLEYIVFGVSTEQGGKTVTI